MGVAWKQGYTNTTCLSDRLYTNQVEPIIGVHDIAGFSPEKIKGRVNGCWLGEVFDHINHFGSHINIEVSHMGVGGGGRFAEGT